VTGEWRKLHNEELYNLYSSPDIIRQIKPRSMRWTGHVARMGDEKSVQGFGGKTRRRDQYEYRGVDGRIGSEWILGRLAGGWSGFSCPRVGTVGGLL
jgi:hypothetical protein